MKGVWPPLLEALGRSEDLWRALIDTLIDTLAVLDQEGRVVDVNRRMCDMFGYSTDEVMGTPAVDFVAEESREEFRAQMGVRHRGGSTQYELVWQRKNGERFPGLVSPRAIYDEAGNFCGSFAIVRDLTEQRRSEATVTASESRFRQLFDNMISGCAVYEAVGDGEDFILRDFNRAAERIEQLSKNDLLGRSVREMFSVVQTMDLLEVFHRVWQTGQPEHFLACLYKDERVVGWRENYVYRLSSGEVVAVYDDVTARKQAEELLRESEEKYRALVETTNTGYHILDGEGRVTDANPEYVRLTGHSTLADILGHSVVEWTAVHDQERNAAEVRECLARGFVRNLIIDYVNQQGQIIPIEINARVLETPESVRILCLCRDISERKRAEEQLNALSLRLLQAQDDERQHLAHELHDEFGQLLAVSKHTAHELHAKLNAERHDLGGVAGRLRGDIERAIDSVRTIQRGLYPTILDHLGLSDAIETLVNEFQDRTSVACILDMDAEPLDFDSERRRALYRIVQEALTNVVRHSGASEVDIDIHRNGSRLRIEIRDDGRGIDPAELSALKSYGLMGMRKRAEMCGGSLEIHGKAGEGTVLTVDIPLSARKP
jgi:PAS domain S-box-containing protein